jgi:TatD DNase family protein
MYIDSHTHLYSNQFDEDRSEIILNAINSGVEKLLLPNIDLESIEAMYALEKEFPKNCFAMMGLHPCSVTENYTELLAKIKTELFSRKFIAVGEIGIDLYWDKTFFEQQQDAFRTQLGFAKKYDLPYIIHSRNSFDETMEIVNEFKADQLKAIFHCFSGNVEQAEQVIASGLTAGTSMTEAGNFKLGIGGVVSFKNSGLDKVVEAIDLKHIVLETDAPYLAPMPHRGKRNEPDYLFLVAQKIADIKRISIEEVAAVTTQNSIDVFGF